MIRELDSYKVDSFHIDSIDNPEVFDDIAAIRKLSSIPVDLHLITSEPEKYFELIRHHKVEYVTFQYENLSDGLSLPDYSDTKFGLAITSNTDISVFDQYAPSCSFILFMTTIPGVSGGEFNRNNFKKIRNFRSIYPEKKIHVDGGINAELSFILRNMGVSTAVIGSYLFHSHFIGSAMLNLRSTQFTSHYHISDFMLDKDEIPVLKYQGISFEKILLSIENYRMGFTNVVDDEMKLLGIISNADIRKGLIKNLNNLNNINIDSLINKTPACVFDTDTVSDVLNYIKSLRFPVLFLPVVDKNFKLTGTIKFNNLIKGES